MSLLLFGCWSACLFVRVFDCLTCFLFVCFSFRACVGVDFFLGFVLVLVIVFVLILF